MDWISKTWISKTWICKRWICKTWICKRWICKTWTDTVLFPRLVFVHEKKCIAQKPDVVMDNILYQIPEMLNNTSNWHCL